MDNLDHKQVYFKIKVSVFAIPAISHNLKKVELKA